MGSDLEKKKRLMAKAIDGQVADAQDRVAVCIQGTVLGLKGTLEAILPGWPFGVVYMVESQPTGDPAAAPPTKPKRISLYPRMGRGALSILTRLLLFEGNSMPVGNRKLEALFNFTYDDRDLTTRLLNHPGVADILILLDNEVRFSEIVISPFQGVYLSQPKSFNSLSVDACKAAFAEVARLAQLLCADY